MFDMDSCWFMDLVYVHGLIWLSILCDGFGL